MAGKMLAAAVLGALVVVAPMAALPAHAAVDRETTAPPGAAEGAQESSPRKSDAKSTPVKPEKPVPARAEKADAPKRDEAGADQPKADRPSPDKPKGDTSAGEPPIPAPAKPAPAKPALPKPQPSKPEPQPEPAPVQPPAPGKPAQPAPSRPTPQQPNPAQPEPVQPAPAAPAPASPAPGQPVPGGGTAAPIPQVHRPQPVIVGTDSAARPHVVGIDATPVFWNVRVGPPRELADPGSVPPIQADAGPTAKPTDPTDSAAVALEPAIGGSGAALTLGVLFAALALGGVIISLRRDLRRPSPLR